VNIVGYLITEFWNRSCNIQHYSYLGSLVWVSLRSRSTLMVIV